MIEGKRTRALLVGLGGVLNGMLSLSTIDRPGKGATQILRIIANVEQKM